MSKYIVTAKKLHKRSQVPGRLPCALNISGIVSRGFSFEAEKLSTERAASSELDWVQDVDGSIYWCGGICLADTDTKTLLTRQIVAASGAHTKIAERMLNYLQESCIAYSINTPARQLAFLAQIGHESGGLFYTEELDSGSAYEGRHDLGNTHPDDGIRYKGRGLIQITGRNNYQWLSNSFKVDFVNAPEKLGGKNADLCTAEQLNFATRSAAWFWHTNGLNAVADKIDLSQPIDEEPNLETFKLLTRKINGGYNGLYDRINKFKAGLEYFI